MESQGFSLQHFSTGRPSFVFNRDSPFSPFIFKDVSASPTPTASPRSANFPSPTSRARTRHRYSLTNGNDNRKGDDQAWLTLLVDSRSPKPKLLPLFFGKDAVSGRVELELAKPETVREVKVTLKGSTTHFTQESHTFLEMSQILLKRSSGKLSGKHSYPFSFNLPNDVRVNESNWTMVYPLPPKFHEKGLLYIDYKIVVTVRHGLFPVDNSVMTNIVYMPETVAEPPSPLRERAYLEENPVAMPTLDPNGWKQLPRVTDEGTWIPNACVAAQLSIANPLSFALGTPIPLFIELFTTERDANFDPNSIDVRLVLTLTTRSATGGVRKLDVARAAFWPAPNSSPRKTKLWGEVIVGRSLTPSFVFSKCSVQYSIVLYPRHSPEQSKPEPLLEEEVLLTLRNAEGIVPRSQAPPGVTPPQIKRQPLMPPRSFPVDFGIIPA